MAELTISGKLLTTNTIDGRNTIYSDFADKLAESAQETIHTSFNESVRLSAIVGASANQEAVRAILRSLKVIVKSVDPLSLEAKFEDDLGHWYGADQEMPEDVSNMLQEIIDTSLADWMRAGGPGKILAEIMNS